MKDPIEPRNSIGFFLLMYGIALAIFISVVYEVGIERGKRESFSINKEKPCPQVTPTQQDTDELCSAWLFDSNAKEAKKRICGKK